MKGYQKVILAGVIALTPVIGAGAASAASYQVANQDTMWSISQKCGVSLTSLIKANSQIANPNVIWSGMIIQLPVKQPTATTPTTPTAPVKTPATTPTAPAETPATTPAAPVTTPAEKPATTTPSQGTTTPTSGSVGNATQQAYANQVVDLVNQERAKAGLSALVIDSKLAQMAMDKAVDMYNNNYFDHNSPTYGSPFNMMKTYGISYTYAGENIAKGQRTPQEVMTAWMNSQGHRENILNANYTKIGVSYYNGEWVQEFIRN